MIEATGYNGHVSFDGDFVTITRKGALARMTIGKGDKRIPLGSITAVQYKPPGAMMNGFISFTLAGGNESKSRFGQQSFDAAKDENSVLIRKGKEQPFIDLRAAIESAIAERHRPQAAAAAPADVADQLGRLAALRDQGVLTDEEFGVQKAKLLANS